MILAQRVVAVDEQKIGRVIFGGDMADILRYIPIIFKGHARCALNCLYDGKFFVREDYILVVGYVLDGIIEPRDVYGMLHVVELELYTARYRLRYDRVWDKTSSAADNSGRGDGYLRGVYDSVLALVGEFDVISLGGYVFHRFLRAADGKSRKGSELIHINVENVAYNDLLVFPLYLFLLRSEFVIDKAVISLAVRAERSREMYSQKDSRGDHGKREG